MDRVDNMRVFAKVVESGSFTGAAARLGKFVPVVGGVVAGGFDAALTRLIGRTADRVFTGRNGDAASPAG